MIGMRTTWDTCPVCGMEEIKVEHTVDEHDHPVHIWHCPVCRDTAPTLVCWACPTCAGIFQDWIGDLRDRLPAYPEQRAVAQTEQILKLQAIYYDILTNEARVGMNRWVREKVLTFVCRDGERPQTREEWQTWRNILPWAIQLVGDALQQASSGGGFVISDLD